MDEVYYKIYKSERKDWQLVVLCMQWFDEDDYYQDRFMKDKDGNALKFESEIEAIIWLNDNIKPEMIASEYRNKIFSFNDEDYYK